MSELAVPRRRRRKSITKRTVMTMMALLVTSSPLRAEQPLYQTDKNGMLAPRMPYVQFLARTFSFVLEDLDQGWASGNMFKDQDGKLVPAYVNYALANPERKLGVGHPRNTDVVYPAGHHAVYIRAFLSHWRFTADPECLSRAGQLADWNLARRTPPEHRFGSLFYSTAHKGKVGGSVEGDAIMTDKPAIMALALLELCGATGDSRYRDAAKAVATTLAETQLPAGNWPFRVDPKTGEVREKYTSSAIYAVMLFEELDGAKGDRWREAKAKALRWLLGGPLKTMQWNGFYEDVTKDMGKTNRTNWDCIDTARWLIAHRSENPEYLPIARRLHDWIAKEFVDKNKAWAPAEGLREQKICFQTMGGHTLHWAALLADFYEATGETSFRRRAINACSLVTYWMRDDGANRVGPGWSDEIWFSGHFSPALFMYDTLRRFPELLADNRPHLVKPGSAVRSIAYRDRGLTYIGVSPGQDILLLPSRPVKVLVSGQEAKASAWEYQAASTTITLNRQAGTVEIRW